MLLKLFVGWELTEPVEVPVYHAWLDTPEGAKLIYAGTSWAKAQASTVEHLRRGLIAWVQAPTCDPAA